MSERTKGRGKVLVVIPARYDSSRFPGKALADLGGQPLIVQVAQRASGARLCDQVVVATDDVRIEAAVTAAGFSCEMTGAHPTGTDRIGEVAARHDAELVVNLQGDEPLLDPADVDELVQAMWDDPQLDLATCAHPFSGPELWRDPNAVKVVTDREGLALYFSRAAIPGTFPGTDVSGHQSALRHVGIYVFRPEALTRFLAWPAGELESVEGLEQLRALEHGMKIKVIRIENAPCGVDTPADLAVVREIWAKTTKDED